MSGHAIQTWNFLRLLPLIIGDKVQNPQDNVWQLILQLKDIFDLICAQQISKAQHGIWMFSSKKKPASD